MRPESEETNKILGKKFRVLDKGYVSLIDYMGNDDAVTDAARRSYQGGTRQVSSSDGLLRRLYKNRHTSPFEMIELKFALSMPVFVARELVRHRTASLNELSGRYSEIPDEFFEVAEFREQSKSNKQGRGDPLAETAQEVLGRLYKGVNANAYDIYKLALDSGCAREIARVCLPVTMYTNMVWKIDLHNFLHFAALRTDADALLEIQAYANAMLAIVNVLAPSACRAFNDFHPKRNGESFSTEEMQWMRQHITMTADDPALDRVGQEVLRKINKRQVSMPVLGELEEIPCISANL